MRLITEQEFVELLKKEQTKNESKVREQKLQEEKNKYKKKFKLPSTSKLIAFYLFVVLNVVLIFAMVAMWHFEDLSYLGVLITDVAGQVLTYVVYAHKAMKQNSRDGITYELAMLEKQHELGINQTSNENEQEEE